LDIDKAIKIIRQTEKESQVIPNLMNGFDITKPQAEYIAEIRLRNLNREYLLGKVNERESLSKEIAEFTDTLGRDEKIRMMISDQIREISKKYGIDRKTAIIYEHEIPVVTEEEILIDDYNIKLFLTEHNYFKKISLVSLRSSADQYLKDDDRIVQEIETSNKSEVLFFSDKQTVYKMKAYDLPDGKASGLGEYLSNLLGMEENERIIYIAAANEYKGFMVFGFENGKCAKIDFSSYATVTNRKKLVNAYSSKSSLTGLHWIPEDCDFILTRGADKLMVINSSLISTNALKSSSGMQVFSLKKNTVLSSIVLAQNTEYTPDELEYFRVDKIPSAGHFKA
jgi:DNA gyrase subunit A